MAEQNLSSISLNNPKNLEDWNFKNSEINFTLGTIYLYFP